MPRNKVLDYIQKRIPEIIAEHGEDGCGGGCDLCLGNLGTDDAIIGELNSILTKFRRKIPDVKTSGELEWEEIQERDKKLKEYKKEAEEESRLRKIEWNNRPWYKKLFKYE